VETKISWQQAQANSIGAAAGGTYNSYRIVQEADKAKPHPNAIARDIMKALDTTELKALEK
jgi:hypothetical protein